MDGAVTPAAAGFVWENVIAIKTLQPAGTLRAAFNTFFPPRFVVPTLVDRIHLSVTSFSSGWQRHYWQTLHYALADNLWSLNLHHVVLNMHTNAGADVVIVGSLGGSSSAAPSPSTTAVLAVQCRAGKATLEESLRTVALRCQFLYNAERGQIASGLEVAPDRPLCRTFRKWLTTARAVTSVLWVHVIASTRGFDDDAVDAVNEWNVSFGERAPILLLTVPAVDATPDAMERDLFRALTSASAAAPMTIGEDVTDWRAWLLPDDAAATVTAAGSAGRKRERSEQGAEDDGKRRKEDGEDGTGRSGGGGPRK
jgi:hypothetical protein